MPIAKKRGDKYRCQAYIGKDPVTGKNMYKSFTAATKKAAELMAAKYLLQQPDNRPENITLSAAMKRHIDNKSAIISPTTYTTYDYLWRQAYASIIDLKLADITASVVQSWANQYVQTHSVKSLKNAHGFLASVLKACRPDLQLYTTMPKKPKADIIIPTEAQVTQLITAADPEMQLPVMLAAKAGLRRSEICALDYSDINFKSNSLHVHGAVVKTRDRQLVEKQTKTLAGDRTVPLSADVLSVIKQRKKAGLPLVSLNPDVITGRFIDLRKRENLPHIRFHDLRHFYASVLLTLGVPDIYVARIMGHETVDMTKKVYAHIMEAKQSDYAQKVSSYFANMS